MHAVYVTCGSNPSIRGDVLDKVELLIHIIDNGIETEAFDIVNETIKIDAPVVKNRLAQMKEATEVKEPQNTKNAIL